MISGPSEVDDEEGFGDGDGVEETVVGAGEGGGWGVVDADADAEDEGAGGGAIGVEGFAEASGEGGGGNAEEEEEGCAETAGGDAMDEDGATCAELSDMVDVVVGAVDDGATGGDDVGYGVADAEDGAAGGVGAGSATLEDGLVYADEEAEELGATGTGAAEEVGTSCVGTDDGNGMTVVNDVTITTGGICNGADGETTARVSDVEAIDSAGLDGTGTPVMSKVDDTGEADS